MRAVSLNAQVEKTGAVDTRPARDRLQRSRSAPRRCGRDGYTGKGVGVAVIDTGIAGDLPDFRVSQTDPTSRVIATAVVNPAATTPATASGTARTSPA